MAAEILFIAVYIPLIVECQRNEKIAAYSGTEHCRDDYAVLLKNEMLLEKPRENLVVICLSSDKKVPVSSRI